MKSIVIFGGAGFVGKHLIRRLAKNGYKIIVPYQKSTSEAKLRLLGDVGQIIPFHYISLKNDKIIDILNKIDVCIILKTNWESKKITFNESIFQFNKKLFNILNKSKSLKQIIFFSGLGVNENKSSLRSLAIHKSENFIRDIFNNSIIVRPGIIIGGGDKFLAKLLIIFKMSIFIPLFGDGRSKFQPVFIDDVSLLVEKIVNHNLEGKHIFELVGPNILNYKELYEFISKEMSKKRFLLPIPMILAKILIKLAETINLSPLNLEQLSFFERDNIIRGVDKDFKYLGILPQDTLGIIRKIVKN